MTTGELIKAARIKAGLTQRELSDKLNVSFVNISQWENGTRNPKIESLQRIAEALGVEVWALADFDTASRMLEEDINHKELLEAYDSMNDAGQAIAFQTVKTLADMPEYQKKDEPGQK